MIISRLRMVLTNDELDRITVKERESGKIRITADVHGMKCYEARRFINNIINIVRIAFQLVIIHGYNHGTAILDMVRNDLASSHIKSRYADNYNPGVTYLAIA